MRRVRELWRLHCLCSAYGCRPSSVVGIDDGWLAYQVDVATLTLGRRVEHLTRTGSDGRPQMTIDAALGLLGDEERPAAPDAREFQDPRPYVSEVRRIPESGVW